jgi:hypothetical protein
MVRWMSLKGYASTTIKTYVSRVKSFYDWSGKSPGQATVQEISDFLFYLSAEREVRGRLVRPIRA